MKWKYTDVVVSRQWGLIPHWTKHPPSGALNTINARSEGLLYVGLTWLGLVRVVIWERHKADALSLTL